MKKRGLWRSERGQSVVELALVLPVLVLLLTGILEFGLIIHQYLAVTEAAREGARVAAVGQTDAQVNSKVTSAAPSIDAAKLTVTITPAAPRSRGSSVTVSVSAPVQSVTGYLQAVVPASVQGTATMRVE